MVVVATRVVETPHTNNNDGRPTMIVPPPTTQRVSRTDDDDALEGQQQQSSNPDWRCSDDLNKCGVKWWKSLNRDCRRVGTTSEDFYGDMLCCMWWREPFMFLSRVAVALMASVMRFIEDVFCCYRFKDANKYARYWGCSSCSFCKSCFILLVFIVGIAAFGLLDFDKE